MNFFAAANTTFSCTDEGSFSGLCSFFGAPVWDITTTVFWLLFGGIIAWTIGGRIVVAAIKHFIKSIHDRHWDRKDIEKRQVTLSQLGRNIWRILVFAIVIITAIRQLLPEVNLVPLFTSAGILGVALGFGAQSLVRDFLSGIFIISDNQYRVGDVVDLGNGAIGTVERVGTRSTVLRDTSGNVHYVPNGSITNVINKTMDYSAVNFTVLLHPDSNVEEAIKIIDKIGKQIARHKEFENKIIEAPHFLNIAAFTAGSVELTIIGKTKPSDQWSVTSAMRRKLFKEFEKNEEIQLAYSALDLHVASAKK